jgi:hypothetical protein
MPKLTLTFDYSIKQPVYIVPLECNGIVTSIWISDGGVIQYEVRHFIKGEVKKIYFYTEDLSEAKTHP